MNIRLAVPDDADGVTRVLDTSYPRLMQAAYATEALEAVLPFMTRANPALLQSGQYYVAIADDGRIVGCGGWTREAPGTTQIEAGLGHLRHFATHPDWLGRGIGRLIYTRCVHQARLAGVRTFECWASLNAEPFYTALGFALVERRDVHMPGNTSLPSLIMRKQL
jgi:N-acetylglutamate synthase-like GNAT family acetyltransferase